MFKKIMTWLLVACMMVSLMPMSVLAAEVSEIAESEYDARIGNKQYATLADAFAAIKNGDTVVLLRDIETTDVHTIPDGVAITLDMNGKTIIATDTKKDKNANTGCYEVFYIYGELTVIGNGTIELTAETEREWSASSSIFHNRGGVLTVENGTFTHKGGTSMAYVIDNSGNSYGEANAYIKGGTLTSTYRAIRMRLENPTLNGDPGNDKSILYVSGGYIYGANAGIWGHISSSSSLPLGALTVSGGTVEGGKNAINMGSDTHDNIDVKISGKANIVGNITGDVCDFAIYGGTFTVDPTTYVSAGYTVSSENEIYTVAINEVTPTVSVKDGVTASPELSSKITETLKETQSSVGAVLDVKINEVSAEDKTIVLDITPTVDTGATGFDVSIPVADIGLEAGDDAVVIHEHDGKKYLYPVTVDGDGVVTFTNNVGFSTFTVSDADALKEAFGEGGEIVLADDITISTLVEVNNAIELDLNGHTLTLTLQKTIRYNADATIKNGTIINKAANGRAVDARPGCTKLVLDSVTLKTTGAGNTQPITNNAAEVTITNSTIDAGKAGYAIINFVETDITVENSSLSGYAAIYMKEGSAGSTVEVINSDLYGAAHKNESFAAITFEDSEIEVTVDEDSTVNAEVLEGAGNAAIILKNDSVNKITIAGEISGDVLANYVEGAEISVKAEYADQLKEEGYVVGEADANGMIGVDDKANVSVNGENFVNFAEALSAAQSGDVVALLADAEEVAVIIPVGVTLDLNGYDLTATYVYATKTSDVIDSVGGSKLYVPATSVTLAPDNAQLPVYDAEAGAYTFRTVSFGTSGIVIGDAYTDEDKLMYIFRPDLKDILDDGAVNDRIEITAELVWFDNDANLYKSMTVRWTEALIETYAATQDNGYMSVNVSGLTGRSEVQINAVITSLDTGVKITAPVELHADHYE